MVYSYRMYDTIAQCPLDDWRRVSRSAGAGIFMTPGFVHAVEAAFGRDHRFWHLVVYDGEAVPVACASTCTFDVDLGTLANASVRRAFELTRRAMPDCARIRVLFCGLPVSAGQNHLAIAPGADRDQVLQLLDQVLATDLARRGRAHLIVYKEFDAAGCEDLTPLLGAGYHRAECPPSFLLQADYQNFGEYCAALKSHYRQDIRRSQRKFERAGLTAVHLRDARDILHIYTPEVHRLYEAVVDRSQVKLERLPLAFFHGLVHHLPGQVSLTVVHRDGRIVAFNWGLNDRKVFYFLFCGIDYRENEGADVYFNLMYHQLDFALARRPEYISVGQTADSFKSRLGCQARPLYLLVKGVGPLFGPLLRHGSSVLFPKRPPVPRYSIFKASTAPGIGARVPVAEGGGQAHSEATTSNSPDRTRSGW